MKVYRYLIDFYVWFWGLIITYVGSFLIPQNVYAFSKIKAGFETVTVDYLLPMVGAVGACSFLYHIISSFFKEESLKKAGSTVINVGIAYGGTYLINEVIQSFS